MKYFAVEVPDDLADEFVEHVTFMFFNRIQIKQVVADQRDSSDFMEVETIS